MTDPGEADGFFEGLARSEKRALLLDYDGTLAPFRLRRDEAVPYPGVREVVGAILKGGRTRVVLISGRATEDLVPLLGLSPVPELWGSHGWERRMPDGGHLVFPMNPVSEAGLAEGERAARREAGSGQVESKVGSVALHWRGMEEEAARGLWHRVENGWLQIAERSGLVVRQFDGGLELRIPGRHKGLAVEAILGEMGPGTAVAYLGDDVTDEDAFEALRGRGLGVLVREERRASLAELWLKPPEEMLAFLGRWRELDAGGS